MVREEIVEGIRQAMARGETIERAMMTFYNSGYKKEDIEEAAAVSVSGMPYQVQQPVQKPVQPVQIQPKQPIQQPMPQPIQPLIQQPQPQVVQKVSGYGTRKTAPPSKTGMIVTILLVIALLVLIGILAAVILFKTELTEFFDNLISLSLF